MRRHVGRREVVNAAAEAGARHPAPAARLDVIAARKIELLVVEPPRRVQVHPAGAVLVVRDAVHQRRDEARHARARSSPSGTCRRRRWNSPAPAGTSTTSSSAGCRADSHALAASTTMRARTWLSRLVALSMYVTPVASPVSSTVTSRAIALRDDLQLPGLHRRRDEHRRRREVRVRRAPAAALAAVVARARPFTGCVRIDSRDGTLGTFSLSHAFLISSS